MGYSKKYLIIAQDLRTSGTSEGVVSRSFLSLLRKFDPNSKIDVVYIREFDGNDELNLLPIDTIKVYQVDRSINHILKWYNWIYWRVTNNSLIELKFIKKFRDIIRKIEVENYDHVFVRSSGQGFESILACHDLPILKKAILNFHDPYPVFWDTGSDLKLNKLELNRLKKMWEIVDKSNSCISPSKLLSNDLEYLYGSKKKFYTLPHYYDKQVFNFNRIKSQSRPNKIIISYHGAIQLGRDLDTLLIAYEQLIKQNNLVGEKTEFHIRIKGKESKRLKEKFSGTQNIKFFKTVFFAESAEEQNKVSDVIILLDNCTIRSNILLGKAPFISSIKKAALIIGSTNSELRRIVKNDKYFADYSKPEEIKVKLENLVINEMNFRNEMHSPFGNYFNDLGYIKKLNKILEEQK